MRAGKQGRTRAGLTKASDLRYFASPETILVGIGTLLLTVIELDMLDPKTPLYWWVTDWKWVPVTGAILLIVLPPAISKGRLHLKSRDRNAKRNVELSIALEALQRRTANLVSKVRENRSGAVDGTYINHSLSECLNYFKMRKSVGGEEVDFRDAEIVLIFYRLRRSGQSRVFEKKHWTTNDANDLKGTISTRGSAAARSIAESVAAGANFYWNDPGQLGEAFATPPSERFEVGLGVPVLSGRQEGDDVCGMLVLLSDKKGAVHASDAEILQSYAWFLAVSLAIDAPINAPVPSSGV